MNIAQARRLARLFDEATPPPSPYHQDGEPVPTVHISVKYEGEDIGLYMLCPETTLVRFNQDLYIDADGGLNEWDSENDRLVPVRVGWRYHAARYTWLMAATPVDADRPEAEAKVA